MGMDDPVEERSLFFVWERGFPQTYFNMAVRSGNYKLVGKYGHAVSRDSLKLYDLLKDPFEMEDASLDFPDIKSQLIGKLDQWHEEIILSPNLVNSPRMIIGSPHEKTVILGRNDWKGPKAMNWGSRDAFGYWDVKVEDRGPYEVRLVYKEALPGPGTVKVRVGTRQYGIRISDPANTVITLENLSFEMGDQMFEGWYQIGGNVYSPVCIEIEKL
jgi:arylsulfatase